MIFLNDIKPLKNRILEAALLEFGSKGYDLSSTNVIADKANVAKGTIFRHFKSKSNLFYEVFLIEVNQFIREYREISSSFSNNIIDQIIDIIFWKSQYSKLHPEATSIMMEGISNPPETIRNQILDSVSILQELSIVSLASKINKDNLRSDISSDTFYRVMNTAINVLQATYINKNTTIESLNSVKTEALVFLKIIIRGMEK